MNTYTLQTEFPTIDARCNERAVRAIGYAWRRLVSDNTAVYESAIIEYADAIIRERTLEDQNR